MSARYRRMFGHGEGAERIAAYSDGIFAFAMTLLVVDLVIPSEATTAAEVLTEEWPSYAAFALSFVIIALAWIGHHRRFRVIIGHDTGLIWINLLLLFLIASVPFPTALISRFAPEVPAVVLYAGVVVALQVVELVEWLYCWWRGLLDPSVDRTMARFVAWDFVPVILVFSASIVVALTVDGQAAMWTWLALAVVGPVMGVLTARHFDRISAAASEPGEPAAEPPE